MRSPLYRHADFRRLWAAQTVSRFGSQVSQLALPLVAVLSLHSSAFRVSLLGAIEMLPFLLFALPAGAWVDRVARRPVLIGADIGRALALGTLPLAAAVGHVTYVQLCVVGFVAGTLTVCFDVSYQSYLPALVDREHLVDANAKLELSNSGSQIAGPGLAGLLVQWLTAPYAIAADAVSFVWSALLVGRIERREEIEPPTEQRNLAREIADGLRYLVTDARWRAMATFVAVFNLGTGITGPLILVFAVRRLGLTAGQLGLVFSLGNIGWLVGALVARRVAILLRLGPALFIAALLGGLPFFLVPLATPHVAIPLLVAAQAVTALSIVVFNINGISLYQTHVPPRMLGRMNASRRWIVWGIIPLGSVLGGALAAAIGLRTTLFVGAAISTVAAAALLAKPILSLATVDGDARAPGDGGVAAPAE
ncbi:MAG TPA: MFS transporter [Gaiellaceae bacterium]|jgi:MFS family permease